MDEREIEQGYANFYRKLNRVLRMKDVKGFKSHIARHPGQAGKLSHCLGLSDELAEVEMYKSIMIRAALKDLHHEAAEWLKERDIKPPVPHTKRRGRKGNA